MKILRVFPHRTSFTPDDALAFVGDPPMIRPEVDEVHVSMTFSWDYPEAQRLAQAWRQYYPHTYMGGPVLRSVNDDFTPGLYVRSGVVFTSRGCNHRCPWCLVPQREGTLKLLPIQEGHIIQDNNLLQTPREHQAQVYAMLKRQRKAATFSGGLEAALIDDWVAGQLSELRIDQVFLSCDTDAALKPLGKALGRLSFLKRGKLRVYVLLGFNGGSLEDGVRRLEAVWQLGAMPHVQLWQPVEHWINYPSDWKQIARLWTRPAIMKAMMKNVNPYP